MTAALILSAGGYTAHVLPQVGGGLAALQWRGRELVQHYPPDLEDTPTPGKLGSFPMLPYAGRVRDGVFHWRGKDYHVATHTDEPHGLHGEGWVAAWAVAEASDAHCALTLEHREGPLQFDARMDYRVGEEGLTITTSLVSKSAAPLPFGLGQHPWFPREEGAQLQMGAERFWIAAPGGFPAQSITLPPELDHAEGLDLPLTWRDNCYEGWDGKAIITYPQSGHRTVLVADQPLDWLMMYANPALGHVCLEPQSHLPAAHNMPGEGERFGLVELAPGESLSGTIGISAESIT